MPLTGIDVVVPAHDEEELLGACLDALEACLASAPLPATLTVVLDDCADRTEELARGRARLVHVDGRNVGAARAAGFADALGRAAAPDRRWLATTDADSRVPPTWLADQLRLAWAGADVVAGLVEVDDWSAWDPATRAEYLSGYSSTAGHRHVHGANLALSSRAYRTVGGFAAVARDEDVQLVRSAEAAGLVVAWSGSTPVATSGRRLARTPDGFAGHLARTERAALGTDRAAVS